MLPRQQVFRACARSFSAKVNGKDYNLDVSKGPVVAICMDGTSQDYYDAAMSAGAMPNVERLRRTSAHGLATSMMPSFTNPNNVSIVTGAFPEVHGVSGNYYFDPSTGKEVPMTDPSCLRAPTILAAFSANCRVAVVTTKDKLRRMLSHGMDVARSICLSVEGDGGKSDGSAATVVGRKAPGIYEPEASLFCLEAGVRLLDKHDDIGLMYLSTTDYVQHKYAPDHPEAIKFMAGVDKLVQQLDERGAVLGLTADHGMNDKTRYSGAPCVTYLEPALEQIGITDARVILPITDPHVMHHGSLGSYATVYLKPADIERAFAYLRTLPGVYSVLRRKDAARGFRLPEDRIGDLVIVGTKESVLGRSPEKHDLTHVATGLRSHGGLEETTVPVILNRKLKPEYAKRLGRGKSYNSDLFDYLINGTM